MLVRFYLLPLVLFLGASSPTGTPPKPEKPSDALLLAQTCVAEIGFTKQVSECQLMWEVNSRNARYSGRTIAKQTLLFNAYWKNPNKNRAWIQHLRGDDQKPPHWPDREVRWSAVKNTWKMYLQASRIFLKTHRKPLYRNICPAADDYGGRCDDGGKHACDKPKQDCARQVKCLGGRTFQAYWDLSPCRKRRPKKVSKR